MEHWVLWILVFFGGTQCLGWMDERPVLEAVDGNLIIWSAKDKNVTIKTLGSGYLTVNDVDLIDSTRKANRAARLVESWRNGYMLDLQNRVQRLVLAVEGPNGLQRRIDSLWWGNESNNSSNPRPTRPTTEGSGVDDATKALVRDLTGRVRRVESRIRTIVGKLRTNQCSSNPCQNGGTCIKIYDGFQCICPSNWQGPSCAIDVDECLMYAGTDLGCQNGATCINTLGSYKCACTTGWFGIHCASKTSVCSSQDSRELCGNGVCVEQKGTPLGFTCICNQGWKSEGADPACSVDVDECAGSHPACSMSPRVECINIPGSFHCGSCPIGYTGSGHYCSDIDECLVDNGGCSTVPKVQCINTLGSRICGACPPGYQGDGVTCVFVGSCRMNNGGCHPLATCLESPGYTNVNVLCRCPIGYEGSGMGPNGCVPSTQSNPCASNPCVHGTCYPNPQTQSFRCVCESGFSGTTCANPVSPCLPNPCKNNGICTMTSFRTFSCECMPAYKGPRCETSKDECGGIIRDAAGSLSYPSNGGLYSNDKTCVWIFITNSSLVLNVTFTKFKLEETPKCRHDFLQIHDGGYAGTHQIGRFCGHSLPKGGSFTSTHNSLYMWLNTDSSKVDEGFALTWNSIEPVCGGTLTGDHGTISSPGSPGMYAVNRDCTWNIEVRPGKRIQFHFFTLLLEEHPTCTQDYVEINETIADRPTQLGLYCNHSHPEPLLTSGPSATVHFHSDEKGQDAGFQLSYTSIEGTPGCGGVYTTPQGTISSPREGETYAPDMYCEWKIQLPIGEKIRLSWTNMDIESNGPCYYDFVEVYEGPDVEAPMVGRYCGEDLPPARTLDTNIAVIIFRSDWSHERKGFVLKYDTHCGGEFHEPSGTLTSPYYPNDYPTNKICNYEIIQPPGKAIVLRVVDLDIEGHAYMECYFDFLRIYDGDNENATQLAELCGGADKIPDEPLYSTHNFMFLRFETDGSYSNRGFLANYTTVDRRCGGLFKTPSGTIQSPGDGNYGNNEECVWTIQAPPGHVIQLKWSTFNLEDHDDCKTDFVSVKEEYEGVDQTIGTYCGDAVPPTVTSQGRTMTITFMSDSTITSEGFLGEYMFVDQSTACGGHYHSPHGFIRSPGWPEWYENDLDCVWIIEAPNKMQINLDVLNFTLENQHRCAFDYLEIRNGGHETSPLIGKYCGDNIPGSFQSLTNQLYLKFVSDSSRTLSGFNLEWESSTRGCGGTLSSTSGEIMSPYYPMPYARSSDCIWTIAVAAGSKVQILFVDLELEFNSRCRFDYLEISEGTNGLLKNRNRFCGTDHPLTMAFDSNLVTVHFRSDYTTSGKGFHIKYTTLCQNKVHGFSGVIESPNFPNSYPENANCTWIIDAPVGNSINVSFSHLDLEASYSYDDHCDHDVLEIKEGTKGVPNTELKKFCSIVRILPKITSKQNQLFITFRSDRDRDFHVEKAGFRLEWIVDGCGGRINRPEGVLTSPGYPHGYAKERECEWLIEVDYGHSVQINFTDVDLEKSPTCTFDKVELFGGADAEAPKLAQFCLSKEPIVFVSPVNKIFVKMTADQFVSGRGFSANFKAVPLTCGGVFKADQGNIQSPNYPMNYPHNQNCEWLIEVDRHHVVNITFVDIDFEHTSNCTDDYVKVFDGASRENEVLGTFCKRGTYPPIISTGDTILVVMRTDSLIAAKGFRAEFSRACGARIVVNDTGVLSAADDLHLQHPEGHNCSWTIVAADPADHVTLTIQHMDLICGLHSCDDHCSSNTLEVHEGESVEGPLKGKWCTSKVPPPLVSVGNSLTVHLVTQEYTNAVFSARYSALNSACGGDYYSESGVLASPGYPDSYPLNAECIWTLHTSPGNSLELIFSTFDIESSPNCDRDYLEIREESSIGTLLGVFCGNEIQTIVSKQLLWMKFRSDDVGTGAGFVVDYAFKHGGELYGPSGVITSPLYPRPFNGYDEVTWRVTVETGFVIRIEIDDFHIGGWFKGNANKGGGLQFYDGYNSDAPLLYHMIGYSPWESSFETTSNVIYIVLGSHSIRFSRWFKLRYYQIPKETKEKNSVIELSPCNEEISLTDSGNLTQFISSPGFPHGYGHDLHCNWVITSPPGTHLLLRFLEIDIEESHNCVSDSISVFSGFALSSPPPASSTLLGKYCRANESLVSIEGTNVMTVKFETDMFVNKTGFRAMIKRVCGGELSDPSGIIEFNETIRSSQVWDDRCEWNITVRPGRTIQVMILSISIPNAKEVCSDRYLLFKNGRGPESPLLGNGKYCSQEDDSLLTTGNALYIKAVGIRSPMTFKVVYREVGMECGGTVQMPLGYDSEHFTTPRYPNMPPPFSECFWTFMAPPGHRLSLHFVERFDLFSSPDCEKEYVEVRDGGTDSSQLLGTFCGDTAPTSLPSTGNMLYVHYYTEVTDPGNGFNAMVTTGDLCGGIIRGKSGTITSPNYPAPYPRDKQCVFWIVGPPDHTLKLEFRDLHLPGLRRCNETDHVIIKEKSPDNETGMVLGTFCGRSKPGVIQTSMNEALVVFHSDHRSFVSFRGFSLNFTASRETCGGDLSGPGGLFHTLGYPNPTLRPIYCEWRIRGEEGSQVVLDILDVDTGSLLENRHGFYLAFFNDLQSKSKITVIRPGEHRERITSSSNTMLVTYWSTSGRRGLNARFSVEAPAPCGGVVEEAEGSLMAPNTPPFVNASFFCAWEMKAPQSFIESGESSLTLTVTISGVIGRSPRRRRTCKYMQKYVAMTSGESIIGVVCGNATETPFVLRSPSPLNSIRVLNGTFGALMNFDLKYKWSKCGGVLTATSHTIQAPTSPFPRSCAWNVEYPEGEAIQMTFNRFNIGSCDKGYIIVRNGGPESPEVGRFCGNIKPKNITSSTNRLWIEYSAAEAPGDFEFNIDTVSSGCGGSTAVITSPGFPGLYPNNSECVWEMIAENGYHIDLTFVDRFNLEKSDNCALDYVQIFDWSERDPDSWKSIGKVCGRDTPTGYESTSNRMKVIFRSNEAVRADGFKAIFDKKCGGIFRATGYPQIIESPNYPSFYAGNLTCNYTIVAPTGKLILMEFEDFSLEGIPPSCKFDNLTITTGFPWMRESSTHCGGSKPPIQWSFEKLIMILKTDEYVQRRGFKLKYLVSDCGGEINKEEILQPPTTTESQYFGRLNCTWIITAPTDKSVALRFQSFELEYNRHCFGDRVAIYEGGFMNRSRIRATYCGNLTESLPVIKSIGNVMTVNFMSDASDHFKGFKAKVLFTKSVASGCGGEINLTKTQTWRSQKEDHYDNDEDCMWIINTASSKNIKITFNTFDVKNSVNKTVIPSNAPCNGDFLEVRDGRGQYSELIGRYCGSHLPPPITSTRNTLWIRFFSDDGTTGSGVRATLEPIDSPCGESLIQVSNTTKTLKSPGFPSDFPLGTQCKWRLLGTPGRDLHIHLKDVDMEDEGNCAGDRLQITDLRVDKHINQDFGEDFIVPGDGKRVRRMGAVSPISAYTFCGKISKYDYYSGGHEVELALRSVENNPRKPRKFEVEISVANCTRNYTSDQGRISHQGFQNCWITITVPQGHTISLYFLSLRIFDSAKCPNSYVKIYDGDFGKDLIGTFCGMTIPSPVFSSGNRLSFMSNSHRGVTWENYDILYTSTDKGRGCGGRIFNYGGTFTSPMYPQNYRNASECRWDVSVPRGSKVLLEFTFFDLGSPATCDTDYVEIKDEGSSMTSILRYCGGERPAKFKSNSNEVTVTYVSSINNGGTGWVLDFLAVEESYDDSASGPVMRHFDYIPRAID